ncbi:hypothetical protein BHC62_09060 [Pseudomonas sp. 06C 126]|nr:hypothetical protein BHC62_09060 [Pseudomonas sp. 06C 126]
MASGTREILIWQAVKKGASLADPQGSVLPQFLMKGGMAALARLKSSGRIRGLITCGIRQ